MNDLHQPNYEKDYDDETKREDRCKPIHTSASWNLDHQAGGSEGL